MDIEKLSSLSEEFLKLAKKYNSPRKGMKSRWSTKYKKKIDCNNPKGFSQKAYCARKKRGGSYKNDVNNLDWLNDLVSKFKEKTEQFGKFLFDSKKTDKEKIKTKLPSQFGSPSKACRQALLDANNKWSNRKKQSDGIMGDIAHQTKKSDHNIGNAVDITHDPQGCSGDKIAEMATKDPRVSYVIWNNKIWNPSKGWSNYKGPNPHTTHVHISIKNDRRDDDSPWPWAL